MKISDNPKVQEGAHIKSLSPEEGERITKEAARYRINNADNEAKAELERRARYGKKEG